MNEATSPDTPRASESTDLVPLEEERAVIAALKAGDRTAFATLYGWYGEPIYRSAILPRLPNRELAEDALRDTFRTALEKIDSFQLEDRSIFFWLRRIAVNKAIDAHRRTKRDRALIDKAKVEGPDLGARPDAPDRNLEVQDTRRMVETSLSMLNERYAEALKLRLIDDLEREECAAILGVTLGNFDVILHRAAKAFRKVFPP